MFYIQRFIQYIKWNLMNYICYLISSEEANSSIRNQLIVKENKFYPKKIIFSSKRNQ